NVQSDPGWRFPQEAQLQTQFLSALPFKLTRAQQRAWQEIATDLDSATPMLRLVQGDVGCGKTIVAALAAVRAVAAGAQAAVMAPTELLAEQHARNFAQWLAPLDIRLTLLTGKLTGRARQQALGDIERGDAQVVLGTHALFQEDVRFAHLGLAVIDE